MKKVFNLLLVIISLLSFNSCKNTKNGESIIFSADKLSLIPYEEEKTITINGYEFIYYNVYNDGKGNFVLYDDTSYLKNYNLQFGIRFKNNINVGIYDISKDNPILLSPIFTDYENGDYGYQVYQGFEIKTIKEDSINNNIGKITNWC